MRLREDGLKCFKTARGRASRAVYGKRDIAIWLEQLNRDLRPDLNDTIGWDVKVFGGVLRFPR